MAGGCLWEESPSKHSEHGLGTAARMNLFCTILCFCIQLQALFGTEAKGLGSCLHCITFISNHVALELDLCLPHISVSQGIPEDKATLQSQVKGACEHISICVFPFSPTYPANCGDKASTLVTGQHAVTQWFRADPLTRWETGSGAAPFSYTTWSKSFCHPEEGNPASFTPLGLRLRPLAHLAFF